MRVTPSSSAHASCFARGLVEEALGYEDEGDAGARRSPRVDIASGYRDLSEPGSLRCITVRTPFSVSCSVIARTRLSAASAAS